jgi:transcriptional regulator with XRE-family HTH domain
MTRAENVKKAQDLRAQGLLVREIAERMGVKRSTAQSWLSDPDRSKALRRRARYSQPCIDCGAPTDGSGGFAQRRTRCSACSDRYRHDQRHWTPDQIVAVLQQWAEELGAPPSATLALRGGALVPCAVVQREFGSWSNGLRAAGLAARARGYYGRPGEDRELCREIAERYEAGATSSQLAREYQCTPQTICERVRSVGGVVRPPGRMAA